jgi:hypothetical protein
VHHIPNAVLRALIVLAAGVSLASGCAGSLPAVVSSTPDAVSIEYRSDAGLQSAAKLARSECERHGREAEFSDVVRDVTRQSHAAVFRCVSGDVAAGSAE